MRSPQKSPRTLRFLSGLLAIFFVGLSVTLLGHTANTGTNHAWALPLVRNAYNVWKTAYVRPDGMVYAYDWSTSNMAGHTAHPNSAITEGQSYAMLMSVFMSDRPVFDKVWQWTQSHMQTRHDKLFNWWVAVVPGPKGNPARYGTVEQTVASDGDELIAYALLLAAEKWGNHETAYASKALEIIRDLWRLVVVPAPNGRFYYASGIAGDAKRLTQLTINPSYLMPYVYRKFAHYDTVHQAEWLRLASDVYGTLNQCAALNTANLPPDWCNINLQTGQASVSGGSHFGWEAKRVFWHIAMDAVLENPKAVRFLKNHAFLAQSLLSRGIIPNEVDLNGRMILGPYPYTAGTMMVTLAQLNITQPTRVQPAYNQYAAPVIASMRNLWSPQAPSYYDPAVAWFGLYTIAAGSY